MTSDQTHIVVGASLAGAKAAETLREEGFDGRLVLIGAENERPYERPPLSKDYLRGEVGRDKVYVHDEDFYVTHEIDLRLGRAAVSLSTSTCELTLDSSTTGCCSQPGPSRGDFGFPERICPGCCICAALMTPTRCVNAWTMAGRSSSSGPAG